MKNTFIYSVSSLLQTDTPYLCPIDLKISSLTAVTYCRLELQPVMTKIPKCDCLSFNICRNIDHSGFFFIIYLFIYLFIYFLFVLLPRYILALHAQCRLKHTRFDVLKTVSLTVITVSVRF